jgi:DUF971 family protein
MYLIRGQCPENSPSAEVQGHGGPNEKRVRHPETDSLNSHDLTYLCVKLQLVWGRKYVNIIGVEPQGNYAILIKFDDLHETGIYSWQYLYWLGENKFAIIRKYLTELKAAGKSRDPRRSTIARTLPSSAPPST